MTTYDKPQPYDKPQTYDGDELVPGVVTPGFSTLYGLIYGDAAADSDVVRLPILQANSHEALTHAAWGSSAAHESTVRLPIQDAARHEEIVRALWGDISEQHGEVVRLPWQKATAHDETYRAPWADISEQHGTVTELSWGVATAHNVAISLAWGTLAKHARSATLVWKALAKRNALIALPWGRFGQHGNGYVTPWPVDPNPGDPGSEPISVPILPVYFMIPTMSAVRLPERTEVKLLSATLGTDGASWGWTFSASMPATDLPLVNPSTHTDPVELEVTINGYVWTVLVEGCDDQRRFGLKTANIRGRSRSAVLAADYAPPRSRTQTSDRTASQLADEELVGTGWTLVWDALDWLVPGGTFSYADLAPIDALVQIAASVGARIETDRAALELRAVPSYDISPWEWGAATPYAILPANIVAGADGSWQGGPNANGVYVYSENAGFGALVRITGTAGEIQVPMVVDRLTVSADPARERGRQELARASKIKTETVSVPLMPSPADPGLIPLGALLEIDDGSATWRGQCMGVRIDASRSGTAFSVRQQLQVERHFR